MYNQVHYLDLSVLRGCLFSMTLHGPWMSRAVIYCYVTNHTKTSWLRITITLFCSWFTLWARLSNNGSSHVGRVSWETWLGPEGGTFSLVHSHGWQVGAGCQWEALVPPHTVQSTFCLSECLHSMATGFMQSQWFKREGKPGRNYPFYNLVLKVL